MFTSSSSPCIKLEKVITHDVMSMQSLSNIKHNPCDFIFFCCIIQAKLDCASHAVHYWCHIWQVFLVYIVKRDKTHETQPSTHRQSHGGLNYKGAGVNAAPTCPTHPSLLQVCHILVGPALFFIKVYDTGQNVECWLEMLLFLAFQRLAVASPFDV